MEDKDKPQRTIARLHRKPQSPSNKQESLIAKILKEQDKEILRLYNLATGI